MIVNFNSNALNNVGSITIASLPFKFHGFSLVKVSFRE